MSGKRNTQLDGWRAFAVLGVMCHHWLPSAWRGIWPFEIGLYFFLTLTGFFISRVLLTERTKWEQREKNGGLKRYVHFQKRRMARILVPCYVAMAFAYAVGAPDLRANLWAYVGHWSNFHMAGMTDWPSGTAHFWTLAIQIQFYALWPFVIFFTPRKALTVVLWCVVALAPLSRFILEYEFPNIHHLGAVTFCAFDYFGVGALLALAMERGMQAGDKRLKWIAWCAMVLYCMLYFGDKFGLKLGGLGYIQQTLIAVAFAGLISATLRELAGWLGRLLDHPAVQHIGRLSFGLYLFHPAVPLLLGHFAAQLWDPFFEGSWQWVRISAFFLTSYIFAFLCRKLLEEPMEVTDKRASPDFPNR